MKLPPKRSVQPVSIPTIKHSKKRSRGKTAKEKELEKLNQIASLLEDYPEITYDGLMTLVLHRSSSPKTLRWALSITKDNGIPAGNYFLRYASKVIKNQKMRDKLRRGVY